MSSVCADEIPFEVVELTTLERVDWFNHRRQSMPRPLATWQPLLEDAFAVTSTPGARRDRAEALRSTGSSRAAIAHHYDLRDDFFKLWLGGALVYSVRRRARHIVRVPRS